MANRRVVPEEGILEMYVSLRKSVEEAGGRPDWIDSIEELSKTSVVELISHLGPNGIRFCFKHPEDEIGGCDK